MSKEILVAIIGLSSILSATILKGCMDVWIVHLSARDKLRKDLEDKVEKLEAKIEELKKDYWILYEKHILETMGVIGNRDEIDKQLQAFRIYRATITNDALDLHAVVTKPEPEHKTYLEISDQKKS